MRPAADADLDGRAAGEDVEQVDAADVVGGLDYLERGRDSCGCERGGGGGGHFGGIMVGKVEMVGDGWR